MRKPQSIRSVVAENVRAIRAKRRISQQAVADQMTALGNTWARQTVSDVEREERELLAKELFGLALVLGCAVLDLLKPESPIDYGGSQPIPAATIRDWLEDQIDLELVWNEEAKRFTGVAIGAKVGMTVSALNRMLGPLGPLQEATDIEEEK